jgi:XTP/dITP diphosphohydrolase
VHSKRYSPEGTDVANNRLLLLELDGVATRSARYRCVVALVGPGGEAVAAGSCEGQIGEEARGRGGFGYDPLFLPRATPGRTMAELSPAEKDAVSHRGAAMAELPRLLRELGLG